MTQYQAKNSADLQKACDAARAGDEILLYGGLYDQPSRLTGKIGTRDSRITIRAADDQWLSGGKRPDPYWGGGHPTEDAPFKPSADTDFALLIIDKCEHVVLDGLHIRDCWPTIFYVKDSSYLVIRNCDLRHATYAIFAKGKDTSHLLIENNTWRQDDSPEHLLWTVHDWARAHGDEGADGLLRYFNGGFLSSKGIAGSVVLCGNRIMDAYNGIRLKSGDVAPAEADMARVNADIHIFDNDFARIRDNPIEPEVSAFNWHVRHNRIVDCHSWFSFDGVTGGYWYFYGNTGRFTSRQGLPTDLGHTMGRVLKLSYETRPRDPESEPVAIYPWFVFNNSWHLRCPLIGGANPTLPNAGEGPDFTAHLTFFNNAFQWCDPRVYGDRICESAELVRCYDARRSRYVTFDYSVCDRPDYLDYMKGIGGETNGFEATGPIFAGPVDREFDFRPVGGALGTGWVKSVACPGGFALARPRAQADGTLNRGALQEYGLTQVPELEAQAERLLRQLRPMA